MLEIKEETDRIFRFEVKSLDGIMLLRSVPFESKKQIKTAILTLGPDTAKLLLFERKTDYDGKFLFHLKSNDSALLGKSGIFDSEAGMENGIKHLKKRIADLAPGFGDIDSIDGKG